MQQLQQISFLSAAIDSVKIKSYEKLEEFAKIIPWAEIENEIEPHYPKGLGGRPAKPLSIMLRAYFLQQIYNLSDPGMEDAIRDRISFQRFLGVDLLKTEVIPDETTILTFRHLLEKHDLGRKIFARINNILEKKGLLLKRGTIMDASVIKAPDYDKKCRERDKEMSSTKKGTKFLYGMKAHIGVDSESGIVHSAEFTGAKEADINCQEKLLHGKEIAVFGDRAYSKNDNKRKMRAGNIFCGIINKKSPKNKKLSKKKERLNQVLSKIRAKVEHPFRLIKHQWSHYKTRYKGIYKNANQLIFCFALGNLFKMRKQLACC